MNLHGKNVYLSGPMTGRENYNVKAFAAAHALVRELGAKSVYDPALAWLESDPSQDDKSTHSTYMLRSISQLTRPRCTYEDGPYYDLLVALPDWEESGGALLEHACAENCGITCVELSDLMPLPDGGLRSAK